MCLYTSSTQPISSTSIVASHPQPPLFAARGPTYLSLFLPLVIMVEYGYKVCVAVGSAVTQGEGVDNIAVGAGI